MTIRCDVRRGIGADNKTRFHVSRPAGCVTPGGPPSGGDPMEEPTSVAERVREDLEVLQQALRGFVTELGLPGGEVTLTELCLAIGCLVRDPTGLRWQTDLAPGLPEAFYEHATAVMVFVQEALPLKLSCLRQYVQQWQADESALACY